MSNKLAELISKCEYGVTISIDQHKLYGQSVENYIKDEDWFHNLKPSDLKEFEEEFEEMKKRDSLIEIDAYIYSQSGACHVVDYDLERAIDLTLKHIDEYTVNQNKCTKSR